MFAVPLCSEKESEPTAPADTCEPDPQAPPQETPAEEAAEKQPDTLQTEAPDVKFGAASAPEAVFSEESAVAEEGASQPDASPVEPVESYPEDKPGAEFTESETSAAAAVMEVAAAAADDDDGSSPASPAPVSAEADDSLTMKTDGKGKAKPSMSAPRFKGNDAVAS